MRFTSFLIFILLSIQIFSEGSVIPEVKIIRLPDPCGDNKTLIVGLYAGEMKSEDNFFGFEYEMTYSKETLLYNGALTNTSFAQFFEGEFSGFFSGSSNDTIYGGGGIIGSSPLTGDRNLVALSFEYTGEPNESAFINYSYLYMLDDYSKTITLTEDSNFDLIIEPQSFRSAELIIPDTLFFDDKSKARLDIQLSSENESMLDQLNLSASFNDLYSVQDITYENNLSFSYTVTDNEYRLDFSDLKNREQNIIASIFLMQNQSSSTNSEFELNVVGFNYNSCVKKIDDEKSVLVPFNMLSVSEKDQKINSFKIFNLLGQTLYEGSDIQLLKSYNNCIVEIEYHNGNKETKYLN